MFNEVELSGGEKMEYPEYYKILELPLSAESAEIKRQFRKLAKKYHPDLHAGDRQAEEMFKKLKEAYEVLSDENKRTAYDLDWKKQRDIEQKQRKKEATEKKKNEQKVKKQPPTEQTKAKPEKPAKKTLSKTNKRHVSFKAIRLFLSLTIIFAVLFFSVPKIMENRQKITDSLPNISELSNGLESYLLKKEVQNNDVAEVKKILQKEESKAVADENIVNFKNADGYSLLMLSKTAEMSKMLIENGAEINYTAPDGATALLLAVKSDNFELVRLLLDNKAEPNITDKTSGYSALMLAKNEEIAYLLLKFGANPNFVAKDGTTALSKAAKENNRNRLNLLQQFGAQINWSDVIGRYRTQL